MRALILLFTSLSMSLSVHAATTKSFTCNKGFARLGDSKWSVIEKCGQPHKQEIISGDAQDKQQQLIYTASQLPSHEYIVFTFTQNKLTNIELTD